MNKDTSKFPVVNFTVGNGGIPGFCNKDSRPFIPVNVALTEITKTILWDYHACRIFVMDFSFDNDWVPLFFNNNSRKLVSVNLAVPELTFAIGMDE